MPKALKKFTLMLDNGTSRSFERGDDIDPELAAHWYAALHCEPVKPEVDSTEDQPQKGDPLTANLNSLTEETAEGQPGPDQRSEKAVDEASTGIGGEAKGEPESSPKDIQSAPDAQSEADPPARKKPGPKPKAK